MMKTKILVLGLLIMMALTPLLGVMNTGQENGHSRAVYISHAPIIINSNSDMATEAANEGWPGDGTASNPYVIENYEIYGATGDGIYIGNTSYYFVIKNCYIHNNGDNGTEFYNVRNGEIESTIFENNSYDDLAIKDSLSANIKLYNISETGNELMEFNYSSGIDMLGSGNSINGLWIGDSSSITIEGYNFTGEIYIFGVNSGNIKIQNNTIESTVDITKGNTYYILNNTFYGGYVLSSVASTGINIANNTLFRPSGVTSTDIYNAIFKNNVVMQDVSIGNNVIVENNTFFNASILNDFLLHNGSGRYIFDNTIFNGSISIFGGSGGATIFNNSIENTTSYGGIYFSGSGNFVYNNTIKNVVTGGIVAEGTGKIYNNKITNITGTGLIISDSTVYSSTTAGLQVYNNKITYCSQNGVNISNTENITLYNNTIGWSGEYGIFFGNGYANNTTVYGNVIIKSVSYGVVIYNGTGNLIYNNTFYENNGATGTYSSLHIQARDDVSGNYWNTTGTPHGYGNYWSDWVSPDSNGDGIVDNPYSIDGIASAEDYYPRTITFSVNTTPYFSPNGDGLNDTCTINISAESPYYWYVEITNSTGTVWTANSVNETMNWTLVWNGENLSGAIAFTGNYTITVYGSNGYLNKSFSNSTIVDTVIPAVFYKSSVSGGGNNTILNVSDPLFEWTTSSDSNSGLWKYELIINNVPNCTNPLYLINLTTTSYKLSYLPDGTYYWWVIAVDKANNGRFADGGAYWNGTAFVNDEYWWRFTIDTTPPNATVFSVAPTPYSPNGDGRHDVLYINLTFSEYLQSWVITIYNATGTAVSGATWSGNGYSASVYFNGAIPEGDYRVHVYMEDRAGNVATADKWFVCDLTPLPAPTIISPANDTYTNNRTVVINWTAPTDIANWSYDVVQITYSSNGTLIFEEKINTTTYEVNYTFAGDGNYTIVVYRYDTAGNVNESSPAFLHVDTVPPTSPYLIAPANQTYTNANIVNFTWSKSTDTSPLAYVLRLYYTSGELWKEITTTNNYALVNVSVFSATQTIYWNISVMDSAGNIAISPETYEVIIDHQPPSYTYTVSAHTISPNGDGIYDYTYINCTSANGEAVKWIIDIYAPNGTKVWEATTGSYYVYYSFKWGGVNNTGAVLPDGNYTVDITGYDYAGNTANYSTYVVIDLTPPTPPQITEPVNNSFHANIVQFAWQWESAFYYAVAYVARVNGSVIFESALNSTTTNFTLNMTGGNYAFWITVEDKYGNRANSTTVYFTVDMSPPEVNMTIQSALNENGTYHFGNSNITLLINATDDSGVKDMRITARDSTGLVLDTGWVSYEKTYTISITRTGDYLILVSVRDTVGNTANVSANLTLDLTPPAISGYALNHYLIFQNETRITINATDESGVVDYGYSVNGGNIMWFNVSSFEVILPTIEGNYTITLYAKDFWGHTSQIRTWIYEVRHTPTGSISVNEHLTNNETVQVNLYGNDSVFTVVGFWLKVDTGAWVYYNYTQVLMLKFTTDGNHTIYVKYVTNLGVESEIYSTYVVVDTAPPTTTVSGVPAYTNATYIIFTVQGNDSLSGFAYYKVFYRLNGGDWQYLISNPANITQVRLNFTAQGTYDIAVVGYDRAGNHEDVSVKATVTVDWTKPTLNTNLHNETLKTTFNVTISWNATDNDGIAYYEILIYSNITRAPWKKIITNATSVSITLYDNATFLIILRAYDDAGNWVEKKADVVVSHVYPPKLIKEDIPNNATAGAITFYADASDLRGLSLNYTWLLGNKTVGYGQYLKINLKPGHYNLTLIVSNGYYNTTKTWNITVKPAAHSGGGKNEQPASLGDILFPIIFLVGILVVVLLLVILVMRRKKTGTEEDEGLSDEEVMILNAVKEYLDAHNGEKIDTVSEAVAQKLGVDARDVLLVIDIGESKGIFTKETDVDGNVRLYNAAKNIELEEKEDGNGDEK